MLHPQQTAVSRQYPSQLLRAAIRSESLSDRGMNVAMIDSSSLLQRFPLDRMNPMPPLKNSDEYVIINAQKIKTCMLLVLPAVFGSFAQASADIFFSGYSLLLTGLFTRSGHEEGRET